MGTTSGTVRFVKPLRGFVKLPREVMALPFWDGFKDRARVQGLFVHVVLNAMHRPGAVVAGVTLCCGEWWTTRGRLAEDTGIPVGTLRRWLRQFVAAGLFVSRSVNRSMVRGVDLGAEASGIVLTIVDWPRYNSPPCLFAGVRGPVREPVQEPVRGPQNRERGEEIQSARGGAGARGDQETAVAVMKVLEGTDGWHRMSSGPHALAVLGKLAAERGAERMLEEARWYAEHEGEKWVVSIRGAQDLSKWGGIRRQMERKGTEEWSELPVVVGPEEWEK